MNLRSLALWGVAILALVVVIVVLTMMVTNQGLKKIEKF